MKETCRGKEAVPESYKYIFRGRILPVTPIHLGSVIAVYTVTHKYSTVHEQRLLLPLQFLECGSDMTHKTSASDVKMSSSAGYEWMSTGKSSQSPKVMQ